MGCRFDVAAVGYVASVGTEEYDEHAIAAAEMAGDLALDARIAAACRGSGNPAALAWLAEALSIQPADRVVDLGSGLGGPAAWLARRYGCFVVGAEPAAASARGAAALFDTATVRSSATAPPFRAAGFDVAVVLGVLSVVAEPDVVLREARRVADRLGVLEWCSTEPAAVEVGGSHFPTPTELHGLIDGAGWTVLQTVGLDLPVPSSWDAAAPDVSAPSEDEREVGVAISAGRLAVRLVVAEARR